jgi:N-methylhydantoinase B
VRSWFETLPDGRYVGHGEMDSDGISEERVPFELAIEIDGSNVRVDYTNAPPERPGPINCPVPSTVSATRIAISMLAGGGESPNEGHFRAIDVVTKPGTLFHPEPPAPCFLYGWASDQAMEVIYQALYEAMPDAVPASCGGDICALVFWGNRERTREPWTDGGPHGVGQGASARGDGQNGLMHISEAATRVTSAEVAEAKNPWLMDRVELAQDSAGAGRHRGGLGVDHSFRFLEDSYMTSTVERTKNAPWGLAGGGEARPNAVELELPDGTRVPYSKATRVEIPKGAVVHLRTGGGGGYGPPSERDPAAVREDVRNGYLSETKARELYPHAFR